MKFQDLIVQRSGWCLDAHLGVGRFVHVTMLAVKMFVVGSDGNHGSIVGGVAKGRNVYVPNSFPATLLKCLSQGGVG